MANNLICKHEPDPKTITFDPRYGRRAICALCGAKLVMQRIIHPRNRPGKGKVKMTKKERRRSKTKKP